MARYGDVGPYAVGNVRIITVEENRSEQHYSDERRARVAEALTGNTHGRANRGKRRSAETRAKYRAAKLGRPLPEETRLKMRIAQQRRREAEKESSSWFR
jgi:hypothetical protein